MRHSAVGREHTSGPKHLGRPRTGRARAGALAAAATVIGLLASPFLPVDTAQAVTHTFAINSFDVTAQAKDANVGDGICATAAGTCTLRAALEESNALNLPAGAILITPAEGFSGNIDPVASGYQLMETRRVSNQDGGAHFAVTAPVTIDLLNRVTVESSRDAGEALFHVNGNDIVLNNMTQALSGETSFVMGPQANGVTIDGGSSVTQAHYGPERFLLFREGAKNITLKNYRVQGFYDAGTATGLIYFNAQNATPIENITIENVRVTYTVGGSCNGSNGAGCRTSLMQFNPRSQNVVLDGFTFTNSFVSNLTNQVAFPFTTSASNSNTVRASNVNITDNEFINVQGQGTGIYNAFITLPYGPMGGNEHDHRQ